MSGEAFVDRLTTAPAISPAGAVDGSVVRLVTVPPSMYQTVRWPVPVSWKRISDFPSPLKSPHPAMTSVAGDGRVMETLAAPVRLTPFRYQMAICAVAPLRNRRSECPSPLKSPTPTTFHPADG